MGIVMVFVLIITTNLIDKNNFVRVRDSVVTIYEDRLVANNLNYEMLKSIQDKELALAKSDSIFFNFHNTKTNDNLQSLILRFEQTKLTKEESQVFNDLKNNVESLLISEKEHITPDNINDIQLLSHIADVRENLDGLSKIQLNEGTKQMSISKRAIDTVELFTQIEIYLLVFLAIIIQIIVMYKPKVKS